MAKFFLLLTGSDTRSQATSLPIFSSVLWETSHLLTCLIHIHLLPLLLYLTGYTYFLFSLQMKSVLTCGGVHIYKVLLCLLRKREEKSVRCAECGYNYAR